MIRDEKELEESPQLLMRVLSGSRAYGLHSEQSDFDYKGVFSHLLIDTLNLKIPEQYASAKNDSVYWEFGKFHQLLLKNNPSALELLASPSQLWVHRHPIFDEMPYEAYLSKLCKESFAGFAIAQIKKAQGLNKKILNPQQGIRKELLDFCVIPQGQGSVLLKDWLAQQHLDQAQCGLSAIPKAPNLFALYVEQTPQQFQGLVRNPLIAQELCTSSIPKGLEPRAWLYFHQDAYSKHCKEYKEYQTWILERNPERYAMNIEHGLNYDTKNMMHTFRLLFTALEILQDGKIDVVRPDRDTLLDIKAGKWSYDELMEWAKDLMSQIDHAAQHSALPKVPDIDTLHHRYQNLQMTLWDDLRLIK